jgi:hypothetical protein
MKLPGSKTIGYGLLATAAVIVVGLVLNTYFGPGQNAERDIRWMQWAIGFAGIGGGLSYILPQVKRPVDDRQTPADSN